MLKNSPGHGLRRTARVVNPLVITIPGPQNIYCFAHLDQPKTTLVNYTSSGAHLCCLNVVVIPWIPLMLIANLVGCVTSQQFKIR